MNHSHSSDYAWFPNAVGSAFPIRYANDGPSTHSNTLMGYDYPPSLSAPRSPPTSNMIPLTSPTAFSSQTSFGMSVIGNLYIGQNQTSLSRTSSIPCVPVQNGHYYSSNHRPPASTASSSSSSFPITASSHIQNPINPTPGYLYPTGNDFQATTTLQAPIPNVHYPTMGSMSPSYHRSPVVPATAPFSLMGAISDRSNPIVPTCNPSSAILPTGSHESQLRDAPQKQVRQMARRQSMVAPPSVHASRMQVGSPAITEASISRRNKDKGLRFFCPVPGCNSKGFTEAHNLRYHMLCHEDKRPFGPCPKCGKYFRANGDLKRHVEKNKKPCN